MSLKNYIQENFCIFKNGKYIISSSKIRRLDSDFTQVINETNFLNELNPTISERLKFILLDRKEANKCSFCDKLMIKDQKFCSSKCSNNSSFTKDKFRSAYNKLSNEEKIIRNNKRTKSFNEKYGGYTMQSNVLLKKMRKTMVEKYGVEHPFQSKIFKNKSIGTWIRKYGVKNPFQNEEIKQKIKQVLMEKYNVSNACYVDDERILKVNKSKIENGWIIPDKFLTDYQIYRKCVKKVTEENYKKYKEIINIENLERVTNGKNGYQLDHKLSILDGFLNNIELSIIGHPCNLQMLPWKENRNKSKFSSISQETLMENIKIFNRK